jgi:ATP-binding cassette subfamily B protein RaxB
MIAGHYGMETDIHSIRRTFGSSLRGASLKQVMGICERIGLIARPVRGDIDDLKHLTLPAILHWDLSHFVVLTRVSNRFRGEHFHILDPARGRRVLSRSEVSQSFSGIAVDITRSERFKAISDRRSLTISQLWSSTTGIWPTLRNILAVSLVIQVIALAMPFYTQIAIDTVFPAFDLDLLGVLAVGFAMLALMSLAANWLRGLMIASANSALSYQIIVNLFRHLTHLPVSWFERRHVGDIVSRFGSTRPITDLLSNGMVTAFVDGLLALLTLTLMFLYSPLLSFIALAALGVYTAIRFGFLRVIKLQNVDVISTAAKENSVFMETVRGANAIKAFAQEGNRLRIWQRSKANAINAEVKLARLTSTFDAVAGFVPSIERIIFLYVAMRLALSAEFTIGMIFAFQAYKQQFLDAGIRLVEQVISFKILQVHLARIADIAIAEPEIDHAGDSIEPLGSLSRGITLLDVRFRFSNGDPEVLSGITLNVKPSEIVALVGPSGGGKTTLLRLMMGLIEPTAGRVFVDNQPLNSISKVSWRRSLGYVAQEDKLFSGSLAENIAFFDPMLDMERVREAASKASVHEEIEAMPMGYESRVGDMGSALSGGQKQRVLLARALYHRPQVLFLDEGTAHLDHHLEGKVIRSLKDLGIAVVMVAHRGQSIAAADTLYHIAGGRSKLAVKTPSSTLQTGKDDLALAEAEGSSEVAERSAPSSVASTSAGQEVES